VVSKAKQTIDVVNELSTVNTGKITAADIIRLSAQIAAIVDPTGIASTIENFSYPVCSEIFPDSPAPPKVTTKKVPAGPLKPAPKPAPKLAPKPAPKPVPKPAFLIPAFKLPVFKPILVKPILAKPILAKPVKGDDDSDSSTNDD